MDNPKNKKIDINPIETKEWIDSLKAIFDVDGKERAVFILNKLLTYSKTQKIYLDQNIKTDYINTIPIEDQMPYPGDRDMERKIKSIIKFR